MPEAVDAGFIAQQITMGDLLPHVSRHWQGFLTMGSDLTGVPGYALPESYFALRRPTDPGDPHDLARARLEGAGVVRAILDPNVAGPVSAMGNMDLAAEVARAANEWQAAEWLSSDSRYLGSVVVGPRDPTLAADEVRRTSADSRFAQVLLAHPQNLLGDRSLYPIYDAAVEVGLPVTIAFGGAFAGANKGIMGAGFPTTPFEYELGATYTGQPHLLSLICNGVFERFPHLRVVFSGFGAAWLAPTLWRADREFRLGRLPHPRGLTRLPSEIAAEHVRVTTAPLELPEEPDQLTALLAPIHGDELLLYASGPLDDQPDVLSGLPAEWRDRALVKNAAELFRLGAVA
jgi:predicted TIM-barrel fold metal-dependent hydrolase